MTSNTATYGFALLSLLACSKSSETGEDGPLGAGGVSAEGSSSGTGPGQTTLPSNTPGSPSGGPPAGPNGEAGSGPGNAGGASGVASGGANNSGAGGGPVPPGSTTSGVGGNPGGAGESAVGGTNSNGGTNPGGSGNPGGGGNPGGSGNLGGGNPGGSAGNDNNAGQAGNAGASAGAWVPEFETLTLANDFVSEGAFVADIDGDQVLDLVAGPRWYRGPSFELGGTIAEATVYDPEEYSLFFLTFADDLNGDGFADVIAVGDAGGGNGTGNPNAFWYQNPGPDNLDQAWQRRPIFDGLVANESPTYLDLVGDENEELVFMTDEQLGYAAPGADPGEPWEFVAISGAEFNTPYVHGLGVGDVNSDGLMDVVEASGYWEQQAGGTFTRHEVDFTEGVESAIHGGSQMYVFDVDADQDADVITSLSGHGYGLSWFEQTASGEFAAHGILPPSDADGNFSQLHAVGVADLNGDGLSDVVTGKRYYAHRPPQDPGGTDPAVLYWFELSRATTPPEFLPHLIHDDSGVGCNFSVVDVDGNGRPDVFTSSKRGTFLHRQ